MKKIINIIILLVVCFLPTVVGAEESNFKLAWNVDGLAFLYEENDVYYFTDTDTFYSGSGDIYLFNSDGEYISSEVFYDQENVSDDEFFKSQRYKELDTYFVGTSTSYDYIYYDEISDFISVSYSDEYFGYNDAETGEYITVDFSEDINFTKNILGKRYDVYNNIKDKISNIYKIDIFDNTYVVYYCVGNYVYTYILDLEYNLIMNYNSQSFFTNVYEKDGIIYIINKDNKIVTYKLDGTSIDSFSIESEWFEYITTCRNFYPNKLEVFDNRLVVTYRYYNTCPKRLAWNDESDAINDNVEIIPYPSIFTLVYDLNFDVNKIESSNGEFTYETKEDEDGKTYVELKITPKDGYSVEDIIVTDINGNRLDVTNNKFLMPMSDVKVEVKYIQGEYLPIPDTLLNVNVWAVVFGILFIIVGCSTLIRIMGDNKVKE